MIELHPGLAERLAEAPASMLIAGPRGCGRLDAAAAAAARHLGIDPSYARPDAGTPDLIWLTGEAGKPPTAEAARAFVAALRLSGERGRRAGLVPDADRLGPQAAAALLKLVEEPRPGTRLYLTAVHPRALPPALLSRCARVGVATPEPARALAWLAARLPEADAPTHAALLELAGGRPGCALDLHAVDALDLHDGLCRAIAPIARGADAADAQRMLELSGRAATPALDGLQRLLERAARAAAGAELAPAIPGEDKLLAGLARRRGIDGLTRWWRQATARIQERDHLHLDPARALLRAATPPA